MSRCGFDRFFWLDDFFLTFRDLDGVRYAKFLSFFCWGKTVGGIAALARQSVVNMFFLPIRHVFFFAFFCFAPLSTEKKPSFQKLGTPTAGRPQG